MGDAEAKNAIVETQRVWQRRTPRALTAEDAREIRENATGFVQVLLQWATAELRASAQPSCADTSGATKLVDTEKGTP